VTSLAFGCRGEVAPIPINRGLRIAAVLAAAALLGIEPPARAAPVPGSYAWPVHGPVIRPFIAPSGPYAPGHRGIDIGAPLGTAVRAPDDGTVGFVGWIAGGLYVSIDHPDGVRTTFSWLSDVSVARGDAVRRGQVFAHTGHGHPEVSRPHLHFGARIGEAYIDPMLLLGGGSVVELIRLAPLEGAGPSGAPAPLRFGSILRTGAASPSGFPESRSSAIPTMGGRPHPSCLDCSGQFSSVLRLGFVLGARGPPLPPAG
jgi:hypothetical protein